MKILLVGGNSSLALALKPLLVEFAQVVTAGRSGCDILLDLANPIHGISFASGFDIVVNTAVHFGGSCAEDIITAEEVNVLGLLKVCRACTQAAVGRLVQVSSIFAGLDPASPFYSMYSLSKKHADEAAQLYAARFGLSLLIIRPAQLYGVGEAYRKNQPFLYSIVDKAQKNQDIVIYGSNDALRNFIHVEDVAMAIARAIRHKLVGNYDCAYPENLRYSQIASAAVAAFGSSSRVLFDPKQPNIPDNAFASDNILYQAIGYFPQISIVAGMQKEAAHRRMHI
jgi:nucleoside-diphosphate-sugar epimerase